MSPAKQTIFFRSDDPRQYVEDTQPIADLLEKNARKAFLTYQHGVYVTAWARYRLYEGQKLAGENGVYCDTDSVKYIDDIDWSGYNRKRIEDSKKSGSFATDPAGVTHYMGVFERETDYKRFRSWGAKKYAYQYDESYGPSENGIEPVWYSGCHVTIAGVNKRKGGAELDAAGGLESFKPGFVFRAAGGTESVYNDATNEYLYVDGHELRLGPNILIRDSTYEVSVSTDYDRLLRDKDIHIKLCKHLGIAPDEIF